ncbi:MAG: TA system VapC family ribonuclease toxin [Gammaproteobacteria bacterium]
MIILDANVLLYAYDLRSQFHARCRDWLNTAFNGREQIGLPWQTILAFVRIATNARAFRVPLDAQNACDIVTSWLARPQVLSIGPGERFWGLFQDQVREAQISGPLVTDAALAALAREHGAALCTTDRDFTRFSALKLIDPRAE